MRIKAWKVVEDLPPSPRPSVERNSFRSGGTERNEFRSTRGGESGRPGFTLIELLVVITIIVILVALAAGVTLRFMGVQQQTNSEVVVRKVYEVLIRQWQAVIDQASKETLPPASPAMAAAYNVVLNQIAGGDPARARVVWVKMRLRQEFPMTFDEVLNNTSPMPTMPSYYTALAPYPSNVYQWPTWDQQNSVLLLLALTQTRGGVALNAEDLGPDTLGDVILPPLSGGLPPGQLKQIVDAWKKPVVFFRWAASNDELDSLDPAGPKDVFRDPQDPTGVLLNSAWWTVASPGTAVLTFQTYCHPLFTLQRNAPADGRPYQPFNSAPYPAGSGPYPTYPFPYYVWGYEYYMVPVVASAGKNKSFGFDLSSLATLYGMKPDLTGDDQDNIYSYRLR